MRTVPALLAALAFGAVLRAAHAADVTNAIPTPLTFGPQTTDLLLIQRSDTHSARGLEAGTFSRCSVNASAWVEPEVRLNVSSMYVQHIPVDTPGLREHHADVDLTYTKSVMLMTLFGSSRERLPVYNSTTNRLASIVLLYPDHVQSPMRLCSWGYPTQHDPDTTTCDLGPGAVALSVVVPLNSTRVAQSMLIQVQILDGSSPPRLMDCIDFTTVYIDRSEKSFQALKWLPFCLALALFVLVSIARVATAVSSLRRKYGHAPLHLVLLIALSGHQLLRYPALRYYAWPGFGEVLRLAQFSALLVIVPLNRPVYQYLLGQWASWALLIGIGGLQFRTFGDEPVNIFNTTSPLVQEPFANAILGNDTLPLKMYPNAVNLLPNFSGTTHGLSAYARAAGTPLHGVYARTIVVWLGMIASLLALSLCVMLVDTFWSARSSTSALWQFRPLNGQVTADQLAMFPNNAQSARRPMWKRYDTHLAVLHGNMVRLLMFFHLPVTLLSAFGMTSSNYPPVVKIIPGVTYVLFALLLPGYICWSIIRLPTKTLYEDRLSFLMFGPLYNMYTPTHEKYAVMLFVHSFLLGTIVGIQSMGGPAQAACVFGIETIHAIIRLFWYPEGSETVALPLQMWGCTVRIALALILLLSQPSIAHSWHVFVRYSTVLTIILYICYHLILLVWFLRLVELIVRFVYGVSFDDSVSEHHRGIIGVVNVIRQRNRAKKREASPDAKYEPPRSPPSARPRSAAAPISLDTLRGTPDPMRRSSGWTLDNNDDDCSSDSDMSDTGMWRVPTESPGMFAHMREMLLAMYNRRSRLPRSNNIQEADAVLHDFLQDGGDAVSLAGSTVSNESLYWLVSR